MQELTKQFEQFAEMMKAAAPQVSVNKNGYEIRTAILELAKDHEWSDYHAKVAGWEHTSKVDKETGELVTTVTMPEVPGTDKILEAAEKFYSFVNKR